MKGSHQVNMAVKNVVRSEIVANHLARERYRQGLIARERLARLDAALNDIASVNGQADCPLKHTFTPGLYVREMSAPAGTIIVTKIHRFEHVLFIMKGRCTVYSVDGSLKEVVAPCMMVTPAGTKRAIYVHEDTIWVTVHANPDNETDLEKIEDFLIAKRFEDTPLPNESKKIKGGPP